MLEDFAMTNAGPKTCACVSCGAIIVYKKDYKLCQDCIDRRDLIIDTLRSCKAGTAGWYTYKIIKQITCTDLAEMLRVSPNQLIAWILDGGIPDRHRPLLRTIWVNLKARIAMCTQIAITEDSSRILISISNGIPIAVIADELDISAASLLKWLHGKGLL